VPFAAIHHQFPLSQHCNRMAPINAVMGVMGRESAMAFAFAPKVLVSFAAYEGCCLRLDSSRNPNASDC
jgi:hypothetical protein